MYEKTEPMMLLVTIVERGYGNTVTDLYMERRVHLHQLCAGHGSASSEVLDSLGVGSSEKDIVFSFASKSAMAPLLEELGGPFGKKIGCRGIAFLLPLTAINRLIAAALTIRESDIGAESTANGGIHVETAQEKKNSLILITVNYGYTDAVMETARKAGATGGTVLRTRWVGTEQLEQFHGITLQEEKEMLMIVAENAARNRIMEAVNAEHGLKTDAHAMLCSLPVEKAFWIS